MMRQVKGMTSTDLAELVQVFHVLGSLPTVLAPFYIALRNHYFNLLWDNYGEPVARARLRHSKFERVRAVYGLEDALAELRADLLQRKIMKFDGQVVSQREGGFEAWYGTVALHDGIRLGTSSAGQAVQLLADAVAYGGTTTEESGGPTPLDRAAAEDPELVDQAGQTIGEGLMMDRYREFRVAWPLKAKAGQKRRNRQRNLRMFERYHGLCGYQEMKRQEDIATAEGGSQAMVSRAVKEVRREFLTWMGLPVPDDDEVDEAATSVSSEAAE